MKDGPGDTIAGVEALDQPPDMTDEAEYLDADTQYEIEHEHEHEVEEERHAEDESYIDESRFLEFGEVNLLSAEAYKRLFKYDKGLAKRRRAREKEWASGVLALKARREQREAQAQARRVCLEARERLRRLVEKLLRMETDAKIRRFKRWQKSQRKVQMWHDRFDSRIAGYAPDQKERLERYRDSLDKHSRFTFEQQKWREEEERRAALSRFEAANIDQVPAAQSKFTAGGG